MAKGSVKAMSIAVASTPVIVVGVIARRISQVSPRRGRNLRSAHTLIRAAAQRNAGPRQPPALGALREKSVRSRRCSLVTSRSVSRSKRLAPRASLGVLMAAPLFLDILWPVFVTLGVEHVRIEPGATAVSPLDLYDYPSRTAWWRPCSGRRSSRGLLPASPRSTRRGGHRRRRGQPLGARFHSASPRHAAFSRRSDPSRSRPLELGRRDAARRGGAFVASVALYARFTRARDRVGAIGFWTYVGFCRCSTPVASSSATAERRRDHGRRLRQLDLRPLGGVVRSPPLGRRVRSPPRPDEAARKPCWPRESRPLQQESSDHACRSPPPGVLSTGCALIGRAMSTWRMHTALTVGWSPRPRSLQRLRRSERDVGDRQPQCEYQ